MKKISLPKLGKTKLFKSLKRIRITQEGIRVIIIGLIMIGLIGVLLRVDLFSLLPGANKYEQTTIDRSVFYTKPWESPVYAPYYNTVKIMRDTFVTSPLLAARLVSATLGVLTLVSFFFLIRRWFSSRIAIIGVLLLASNSWFLTVARSGSPEIILPFATLSLFLFGSWLRTAPLLSTTFLILCVVCGVSLYFPYMLWLLLIGAAIVIFKDRKKLLIDISLPARIIGGVIIVALAAPIVIAIINQPSTALELLGLNNLPEPRQWLTQLITILGSFFVVTEKNPALHLGTLPLFEMFSAAMLAVGFYSYEKRLGMRRSIMVSVGFVLTLVVLSLTKNYQQNLPIILPFTMLLIISGLVELLQQWFTVFPKNPIARSLGASLIVIAIGFVSFYHLHRYFIAWPNTPETKSAYNLVE